MREDCAVEDIDSIFGPIDPNNPQDRVDTFTTQETLADIAFRIGAFPSRSQARKNGWDRPIPMGYSEHKIGKGITLKRFYLWNPNPMNTKEYWDNLYPDEI